jgi:hypothetical protein
VKVFVIVTPYLFWAVVAVEQRKVCDRESEIAARVH